MKTKSFLKVSISGIVLSLVSIQGAFAWQLPLQEISEPSCKGTHRSDHAASCKIPFVLPEETVISSPEKTSEKLLFSVLYESSYHTNDGKTGGHPGIDIVSAKGTPVYAIQDAKVIKSEAINGYGKTVVLKHADENETIYSSYAHLDKLHVHAGDTVLKGSMIGEIGNTGFTIGPYGNHLDFQIITQNSPTTPYAYADCETGGYMDAVKLGLCKKKLYKATHNPFEFLHAKLSNITVTPLPKNKKVINKIDTPTVKSREKSTILMNIQKFVVDQENFTKEIPNPEEKKIIKKTKSFSYQENKTPTKSPTNISPRTNPKPIPKTESIDKTRKEASLDLTASLSTKTLGVGRLGKLHFELKNNQGTPLSGLLPEAITVTSNNDNVKLYFNEFQFVSQGKKQLLLQGKQSGTDIISIYVGDQLVDEIEITVK